MAERRNNRRILRHIGARKREFRTPGDYEKLLVVTTFDWHMRQGATPNGKEGVTSSSLVPGFASQTAPNAIGKGSVGFEEVELRTNSERAPNIGSPAPRTTASRQRSISGRIAEASVDASGRDRFGD